MARPHTSGERSAIAAAHVNHWLKVEVREPTGTWVDLSALGSPSVDWVSRLEISEDQDQPAATATLTLRRESQGQTLAPLITASVFNNLPGSYSPLLYAGRRIRFSVAVTTFPNPPVTYKSLGIFKIDEVDWASSESEIVIQARDIGAVILDTFIEEPGIEYGSDEGTPAEDVMQAVLDDWPTSVGSPALALAESPAFMILRYAQEQKGVLEAIRDIALQAGGDVRYRFDETTDAYALTFWRPDRVKTVPDWTLGPDEYHAVDELKVSDADVRNVIEVKYVDDADASQRVEVEDAASIALYERRWMGISEDEASQINTEDEALRMANAALSDLSQPKQFQTIVTKLFWIVQLGDLGRLSANAVHADVDSDLAVIGFTHTFEEGEGNTTIRVRGKPAGAILGWLNKGGIDEQGSTDTRELALKNFREIRRTPTTVTYGWDPLEENVFEVWAWGKLSPQDTDPPLPPGDDEDRLWRNTEDDAPDIRLDDTTTEFEVAVPDFGFIQTWELLPVAADFERGFPQRVKVLSVPDIPRITNLETVEGATGLFTDITALNVVDPQALGGRLYVWLNHDLVEDADPTGPADGYIDVAITPHTFTASDTFVQTGGGTSLLFDNIRIHPGAGKRIFFEFVNSHGISSGVIGFVLLSNGGIIDEDGNLLDDSINRAEQIASSFSLPSVYDVLPSSGRDNELALWTIDMKLYRWNGSVWTAEVEAADISGVISGFQLAPLSIAETHIQTDAISTPKLQANAITTNKIAAGQIQTVHMTANSIAGDRIQANTLDASKITAFSITAGKMAANSVTAGIIAAGAVTATAIAAGAVTAVKISVTLLSEVSQNAGIILAGKLQSLDGLRYLDLNATGSNPFLQHPSMTLRADGSAQFGGTVTATSFTGPNATFTNGMTVAGATLFVSGGNSIIFGAGAAPRIGPNGSDIVLSGTTSGTTLIGRVKKQIGGIPGTPIPIPGIVVDTTAAVPSGAGNYSPGDLWIDVNNLRIYVISGGAWTLCCS